VIFIWLVIAALIGAAVGLGYLLPGGDEMTYANISDSKRSSSVNVFLRDISRGLEQRLTNDYGTNALAKWSPDGTQIAYLSLEGSMFGVYLMDAVGRNKHPLGVEFTTFDSTYIWSPDSQWILFSITDQGVPQSLIVNARTGEKHQLPQTIGAGMWSPDSQNILYQASTENGISHLYGMNIQCFVQGSPCQFNELDFLGDSVNEIKLVWSPDGKRLAYTQFADDNSKLVVAALRCMELKATCIESKKVVADISYLVTPLWSADSQQLAFASSKTEISIVQLESGATRTYNLANSVPALQNWSPDGRFITFFANQGGNAVLFMLDTVTGDSYPLLKYQVMAVSPSWRPAPH
jgi:Tol biopolymer transport system component